MSSLFDKLNLRPGERRLVVVIGGIVFVVLNLWLVFPHFGDLAMVRNETKQSQETLASYQALIQNGPVYDRQITALAEQGAEVAEAKRSLDLQREVSSQALLCNVAVQRYDTPRRTTTQTNAFFDEQSLVISVNTGESELICFLYKLAERSSLIRVRSMSLSPDPRRYRLQGNITLVASYQKAGSVRATRPAPPAPAPVAASDKPPVANPAPAANAPARQTALPPKKPTPANRPATPSPKPLIPPRTVPSPPAPSP